MEFKHVDYNVVDQLSTRDRDYINRDEKLIPFINDFPSVEAIRRVIKDKNFNGDERLELYQMLSTQMEKFDLHPASQANLELLKNKDSYTIITAHQPTLFTGPLYFIFKILSTLNLCNTLNKAIPESKFIPIFVMGAEDHDFDEINHLHLFGNTIEWEKEAQGPVGRLDLEGLKKCFEGLKSYLPQENKAANLYNDLESLFDKTYNYRDFSLAMVHRLFGRLGLVPITMDNPEMKRKMIPFFKDEIFNNKSEALVQTTQKDLASVGYDGQAYVRPINVFYMTDTLRGRIEANGDAYEIVGTDLKFDRVGLEKELDSNPERFSPNVVLRPLYQELIIPNLAYIGGGGELAYWMERKSQFEAFGIPFPILIRRNSALLVEEHHLKKLTKLGLNLDSIFKVEHELIKTFLDETVDTSLIDYSIEKENIDTEFKRIAAKAKLVDPTLEKSILAEASKVLKQVDQMASRVEKRLKSKEEIQINQLKKVKESLFPGNGLQERYDNIFAFLPKYGEEMFDELLPFFDPLKGEFLVVKL